MKTKATGGNEPKAAESKAPRPPRAAPRTAPSYTYNHATGLYSMDARALTEWLMDVQGRARMEKRLACYQVPFDEEGVVV